MGKVIGTILLIAAVIAIAIFVPQLLAAVGVSVAAGMSAAAVAAITMAVTMVATLAVSFVAQMLMKPKAPKLNQAMQDRLNVSINPIAPRKIVFGQTAAGADVRFQEKIAIGTETDTNPDMLYQVVALASHKLTSIQSIYFEDELSYSSGAVTGKYASGLTIAPTLEGTTANAAAFGTGTFWTSTAKFTGCAYLKITYKLDNQIFPEGLPQRITTIVHGCPVYDPRLDSTHGGSGSQRPTDQTTWVYSNNPALCLLTYLLGWKLNGVVAWGMGVPTTFIDFSSFITYANVCDESVTALGGGTVKRYQCDAIFSTDMTHEAIITSITNTMGTTVLVDTGGMYSLIGGHDDTTGPILSFTQDDLVGSYTWKPFVPSRDRFNIATGRYADPNNLYVLGSWGQIAVSALPDGIPRTQQMDFAGVSRPEQCQRIAKQRIVRNQYQGTFTCNFGPRAFECQVGSLMYLSLSAEGWNNKLFRVIDQQESVELIFQLTLQEENAAVYAWDYNETLTLPANVNIGKYDPTLTSAVIGLTTSTRQTTNSTGATESWIDVHWTRPSSTVKSLQIQAKPSTATIWQNITSNSDPQTGAYTFKTPVAGVSTDVQARYVMNSGKYGAWTLATLTAATGSSNGLNNATVFLYQRPASAPSLPSVTTTYTFATGVLTGANNGWLTSVPTTNGNPLYVTVATASGAGTTDTIASTEWASATIMAQDGATGSGGVNTASIFLYKRSASSPALPSATTTYTFSTGVLTGITNGWTQTVPTANGQPCYVTTATALGTGTTDTIANTEWASASILAQDGAAGPTVTLSASAGAFYFVDGTPTSTSQSITFTATSTVTDTFTWSTSPTVTLTGSGSTRTMSLAAFGSNQQCIVTVTGVTSGVSAYHTIYRINESSRTGSIVSDSNFQGSSLGGTTWTPTGGLVHTQIP